ncbi:MAG: hypothetical protein DME26_17690, partial [Verrucomicrobia bacterium]
SLAVTISPCLMRRGMTGLLAKRDVNNNAKTIWQSVLAGFLFAGLGRRIQDCNGARRLPVLRSSTAEGGRRFNMEKRAFPNFSRSMNFDREAA